METSHPLRTWRKTKGVTLAALGKEVGVVASHLSQIETGDRGASLDVALKIHELTGDAVPLKSLLKAEAA